MTAARPAARLLGAVLVLTLGVSMWAVCVEAQVPQSQQMACCKDGELSCPSHSSSHDCCVTDAGRSQAAVVAATVGVQSVKALIVWNGGDALLMSPAASSWQRHPVSPPQFEFGPPPYIAFSSLLI